MAVHSFLPNRGLSQSLRKQDVPQGRYVRLERFKVGRNMGKDCMFKVTHHVAELQVSKLLRVGCRDPILDV